MTGNLNELYKDIKKKNIDDFNNLRDYYINLLKEKNILNYNQELKDINKYKELLLKNGEPCNIRSLWYFLEKKHNKNDSWLDKTLIFNFDNELKILANDLILKAKKIEEEYIKYYYESNFF